MAQMMLVNPRRKRRKAARKMTAKQRQYFAPRRRRAASRAAPKRRRRRTVARAAPTHRRRRRSFRRSRAGSVSIQNALGGFVMPAATGAAGAIGLDILWGLLPIPANLKTGQLAPVIKAAGLIGIGMVAQQTRVLPPRFVHEAVGAGLTVMAYNFIKGIVQQSMPQVALGEYISGYPELGYVSAGQQVGEYISGPDAAVSWSHADYGDSVF